VSGIKIRASVSWTAAGSAAPRRFRPHDTDEILMRFVRLKAVSPLPLCHRTPRRCVRFANLSQMLRVPARGQRKFIRELREFSRMEFNSRQLAQFADCPASHRLLLREAVQGAEAPECRRLHF